MTDEERERIREILIFDYHEENAYVLGLPDEELKDLYEALKPWKVGIS